MTKPIFFGVLTALVLVGCAPTMPAEPTHLTITGNSNTVNITTMTSTMGSLSLPAGLPGIP